MYSTTVSCHVLAPRSVVYGLLLDPEAVNQWRVPDGMRSEVHEFEPREGGRFRVSLTYDALDRNGKSEGRTDSYHGRFVTLVPNEEVVEEIEFETGDPDLRGTMTLRTTLTDAVGGTDIEMVHEGLPDKIPAADNELGTRMSLAKLARLAEAR